MNTGPRNSHVAALRADIDKLLHNASDQPDGFRHFIEDSAMRVDHQGWHGRHHGRRPPMSTGQPSAPAAGTPHTAWRHRVAHDLLHYIRTRNLLDGDPTHGGPKHRLHSLTVPPRDESTTRADSRPVRPAPYLFDVLLDRALHVEHHLAERCHIPGRTGISYDMASYVDDDGGLHSGVCAVVDADGDPIIVNLEHPSIADVVLGDVQRPLRDRVRVASELVRIYRDAVCLLGLPQGCRGQVVAGLGEAVGLLGELVRADGGVGGGADTVPEGVAHA